MKKLIPLLLFFIMIFNDLYGQYDNAFYNALLLRKIDAGQLQILLSILNDSDLLKKANINIIPIDQAKIQDLKGFISDPLQKDVPDLKVLSDLFQLSTQVLSSKDVLNKFKSDLESKITVLKIDLSKNKKLDDFNIDRDCEYIYKDFLNFTGIDQSTFLPGVGLTDTNKICDDLKKIVSLQNQKNTDLTTLEATIVKLNTILTKISKIDPATIENYKVQNIVSTELVDVLPSSYEVQEKLDNSINATQTPFSLSQAAIIDALTTYIIQSVKEGLVSDVFETILTDDLKKNLKLFFPKTVHHLENLKSANMDLSNFNSSLQKLFKEDLKDILVNLTKEENLKGTVLESLLHNNIYKYFKVAAIAADNLSKGIHPIDLLPLLEKNLEYELQSSPDLQKFFDNVGIPASDLSSREKIEKFLDSKKLNYSDLLKKTSDNDIESLINSFTNPGKLKKDYDDYEEISQSLSYLNNIKEFSDNFENLKNYVKFFNIIQKNLRDTVKAVTKNINTIWVNFSMLDKIDITKDPKAAALFVKMLFAEFDKAGIGKVDFIARLRDSLERGENLVQDKYKQFHRAITQTLITINKFQKTLSKLTANSSGSSSKDYEEYIEGFGDVIFSLDENFTGTVYTTPLINENVKLLFKNCLEIYKSISNRSYTTILPGMLTILNYTGILKNENAKNFVNDDLIKYLTFFTEVSSASSQEDLYNSLTKNFVKRGDYIRKRDNTFTFGLGSYPGLSYSFYSKSPDGTKLSNQIATSVPVGLEASFGNINIFGKFSVGIYLSVLDIGAPFRFKLNSGNPLPAEITFKQVFSPGVFLRLPEVPYLNQIKILMGLQYLPELHDIDSNGEQTTYKNVKNFGIYVTYDIPLFYF